MPNQSEINVVQTIYDKLHDIITYSPSNDKTPSFETERTFLQIVPAGQPINPNDFQNAATPTNPSGNLGASENFARLIDPVPVVQVSYAIGTTLSDSTYGSILSTANAIGTVDPVASEQYEKAYKKLNKIKVIVDEDGEETIQVNPSVLKKTYDQNQRAYSNALTKYRTTYNSFDLTDPKQQREWVAIANDLEQAVDEAWNTWQSQGAADVEDAVAKMNHSINSAAAIILENQNRIYTKSRLASISPGGVSWHMSYAMPTNWYDPNFNGFTEFKLSIDKKSASKNSEFERYDTSASFNSGLWNIEGSTQHTSKDENFQLEATKLEISMQIGVVNVFRPWMNGLIYSMPGWRMDGFASGSISTGSLDTARSQNPKMPLLPVAFVVARNVTISGDWGNQDRSLLEKATTSSAGASLGPFRINGNYSSGTSSDTFKSRFEGGTITIPGIQIIAWISEVVPFCPPL